MKLSSLLVIIAAAGQSHAWTPGLPATSLGSKVTSNVNDGIKRHNAKNVALSRPLSVRGGTALDMTPA
eukprot:scaffold14378_cov97-Skeletonema_marinoi.AAC.3